MRSTITGHKDGHTIAVRMRWNTVTGKYHVHTQIYGRRCNVTVKVFDDIGTACEWSAWLCQGFDIIDYDIGRYV